MEEPNRDCEPADWWTDEEFWGELFDFIFPPSHLALGELVAAKTAALLGIAPGAAVLDLGCGPGRVSIPLARYGCRVVGVDTQASYLERAREWASRERVSLELRHANIAHLDFEAEFDAVLSVFTSFGYFAERSRDRQVLERAFRALRPRGRFLLETAHRDGVVRLAHPRESEAQRGRHFREEPRFDLVSGVLETRWSITSIEGTKTFASRVRIYSATELGEMMREAGFRDVEFHGSLDGGPPSVDQYTIVVLGTK